MGEQMAVCASGMPGSWSGQWLPLSQKPMTRQATFRHHMMPLEGYCLACQAIATFRRKHCARPPACHLYQSIGNQGMQAHCGCAMVPYATAALQARECWSVAFGDSHTDSERCVLAGYDNGDLKLFDLRMGQLRWQTSLGNGVCGVQFDRRGIPQNKFAAACLESQYHVFDARTLHPVQVQTLALPTTLLENMAMGNLRSKCKHSEATHT